MKKPGKKSISISSRKSKGRRLQNQVAEDIRKAIQLESVTDVKTALMGETGADIKLSKLAKRRFPFYTECKNQESLSIHAILSKLAEDVGAVNSKLPSKKHYRCGLLVFKRNHSETYAVLPFTKFMNIWERYLVCSRELQDRRIEDCPSCLKAKISGKKTQEG
jgi:hypothetical protein